MELLYTPNSYNIKPKWPGWNPNLSIYKLGGWLLKKLIASNKVTPVGTESA